MHYSKYSYIVINLDSMCHKRFVSRPTHNAHIALILLRFIYCTDRLRPPGRTVYPAYYIVIGVNLRLSRARVDY